MLNKWVAEVRQIDARKFGKLNDNTNEGGREVCYLGLRILTEVVNETAQEGLVNHELSTVVLIMSLLQDLQH